MKVKKLVKYCVKHLCNECKHKEKCRKFNTLYNDKPDTIRIYEYQYIKNDII